MSALTDHILRKYDANVKTLDAHISEIGSLAESMLSDVIQSLKNETQLILNTHALKARKAGK